MKNNIVLIGYMGCGKSSVGKKLAEQRGMDFIDLDEYIEAKENQSISLIFKDRGEVYFRKIETKYLEICLTELSNTVLSLGGGTPCFGQNMEIITNTKNAVSIYLQTSIGELSKRLFEERVNRPLIAHTRSVDELSEFIAKHVFERLSFYARAMHTIQTDKKDLISIVSEIEPLV